MDPDLEQALKASLEEYKKEENNHYVVIYLLQFHL